jgi:hypothetical protein
MLTLAVVICVSKPVGLSRSKSNSNFTATDMWHLLKIKANYSIIGFEANERIDRQAPYAVR